MADSVQVKFGASIQDLLDGVDRVKGAIDGVKESTDRITEGFKSLAEVAGIALSIEGFKSFIESMAQLGLQTERAMATLGISAEQVGVLGGIAKLTGSDFSAMQTAIERMSLNVQKSTRDAFNPAAQGLRALGLSARDLIGLPTDQYFEKLVSAASKFNPSLNLTNALTAIGGKGFAQLTATLILAGEHWDEFSEQVRKTGSVLDDVQARGFAQTHEKLTLLGMSVQGVGIKIFDVLKPAIDQAADAAREWLQSLDEAKIREMLTTVSEVVIQALAQIRIFFVEVAAEIDKLQIRIASLANRKVTVGDFFSSMGRLDIGSAIFGSDKDLDAKLAAITHAAAQRTVELQEQAKNWKIAVADFINTKEIGEALDGNKLNAPAINMGGRDQLAAQMEAMQASIKLAQTAYQQQVELFNSQAKIHAITESQKTADTLNALDARHGYELAAVSEQMALMQQGTKEYQKVLDQKLQLDAKYRLDRQKILDASMQEETQKWNQMLSSVTGAFNSQIRGLLAGTTTFGQAFKNILADMLIKFIEFCEKMAVQWAAKELAQTTATTSGVAARTAAEAAGGATSFVTTIGNALKGILASVGLTTAEVTANVAPSAGPAAPAIGAAAGAATLAAATAVLPSLDVGTDLVLSSGLAMIHAGERITPAQTSGPFTGAGGGAGGLSLNFNGMMVGTQAFINSLMPQLARALQAHQALNPSTV